MHSTIEFCSRLLSVPRIRQLGHNGHRRMGRALFCDTQLTGSSGTIGFVGWWQNFQNRSESRFDRDGMGPLTGGLTLEVMVLVRGGRGINKGLPELDNVKYPVTITVRDMYHQVETQ